jgi:hypothetical protein
VRGAAEPFETGLDDRNLFFDLTDWRAEIVAGSEFEIDGQPLPMHPKIFQGAGCSAGHKRQRFAQLLFS